MTNFNINKNKTLAALQQLVEQNISTILSCMLESCNTQLLEAVQLFKQR